MKLPSLSSFLYKTFYVLCVLGLTGLIIITPADLIAQARKRSHSPLQIANTLVAPAGYVATFFWAVLLYSIRIVSNKAHLKKIPRSEIPIEKGDVKEKVRKMIEASLNRSAVIAWDSRPRLSDQPASIVSDPENRDDIVETMDQAAEKRWRVKRGIFRRVRTQMESEEHTVTIPPPAPVWGDIAHNGWSSPTSPDLPNLQYITVILELPHLIEARAVSLAPVDPGSTSESPLPDIRAVDLLQRQAATCLRDYIGHLVSMGVVPAPEVATGFLANYEYARFSGQTLSEHQFRELMRQFADLLRIMEPLSPAILTSLDIDRSETDIDDDGSASLTPATPSSRSLASSRSIRSRNRSRSEGTVRTGPARSIGTCSKRQEFGTAPGTPRSKKRLMSRSPSMHSFAPSGRPNGGSCGGSSSSSLRSTSRGSVIRLSSAHEDGFSLHIPRPR
ncbi:uncharacterized protein L3040_008108 [Drepanopeziza brunnea f. sp. 'multigermtubi']|uniref:uncharacterized protein n=1 Tax=Drepanopeziza brunnea f. sp. 'multigermtubi' TaxID=698441 RepID=UPI00238414C6|nr:hypothetical protein L3040_008108 [Drepanopeziza brunnea f. sp. 'multigermtubi']